MRFKYDRAQNRKSKVFTDVEYELELELPHQAVNLEDEDNLLTVPETSRYALYAIVVHSGYSSDGGHYYTYAREPPGDYDDEWLALQEQQAEGMDDIPPAKSWYVFNDSKVSYATFESFKSVSKKFPRDVAYQLFYRKLPPKGEEIDPLATAEELQLRADAYEARLRALPKAAKRPLRADLKMAVEKDNLKVMREKERSGTNGGLRSSVNGGGAWRKPDGDDGSGGAGPSCGGGGFNAPGRLVF